MRIARMLSAIALVSCSVAVMVAQEAAPQKVEIVSVNGCLKEQPAGTWMVVNATDPVPSIANAPAKKDLPTTPVMGKNQFRLIGIDEFNLPSHKDHYVIVKGLFVKATPVSRLNITSVTSVFDHCGGGSSTK